MSVAAAAGQRPPGQYAYAHLNEHLWQQANQERNAQVQQLATQMQSLKQHYGRAQATMGQGSSGLSVVGGGNETVRALTTGTYAPFSENHGRTVYKRAVSGQTAVDVFVYFWDERDGPSMCGWWFGPSVGADNVFAFSPNKGVLPPATGWQVPFSGPVDPGFIVTLMPGVAAHAIPQQQALQQQQMQQQQQQQQPLQQKQSCAKQQQEAVQKRLEQLKSETDAQRRRQEEDTKRRRIMNTAQLEEMKRKREEEERKKKENQAVYEVRAFLNKVRAATPENFDALGHQLQALLARTLTRCGMMAESMKREAETVKEQSKQRVQALRQAREEEARRQKLSAAIVLPCDFDCLSSRSLQTWLRWRLFATAQEFGVRVELGQGMVRLWPNPEAPRPANFRELLTKSVTAALGEAQTLAEVPVDVKKETQPEEVLQERAAVGQLVDQFGLLIRVLPKRDEEDMASVRIFGPREAARDAAAVLWARFEQGKNVGVLLQTPSKVQEMSKAMLKDFEPDLRSLEEECQVEIHQTERLLWIAGESEESVAQAKRMLKEMLLFYLADDFLHVPDLTREVVDGLRQDPELRTLSAKEDCVIGFDSDDGSVWMCGGAYRAAVEARISAAVAATGGEAAS